MARVIGVIRRWNAPDSSSSSISFSSAQRIAAGGHPAAIPKSSRVLATYFFFFLAFLAFLAFFFAITTPPSLYETQETLTKPSLSVSASKAGSG